MRGGVYGGCHERTVHARGKDRRRSKGGAKLYILQLFVDTVAVVCTVLVLVLETARARFLVARQQRQSRPSVTAGPARTGRLFSLFAIDAFCLPLGRTAAAFPECFALTCRLRELGWSYGASHPRTWHACFFGHWCLWVLCFTSAVMFPYGPASPWQAACLHRRR